jgi:hypothetical protein
MGVPLKAAQAAMAVGARSVFVITSPHAATFNGQKTVSVSAPLFVVGVPDE